MHKSCLTVASSITHFWKKTKSGFKQETLGTHAYPSGRLEF